jgi:hypothetical protein
LVPHPQNFKIKRKNDDIKILGGTIQFDGDVEKDFQTRKNTFRYYLSAIENWIDHLSKLLQS